MTGRKVWSRDSVAGIYRLYEWLVLKGLEPSRPRWCSESNAYIVTANVEKT